MADLDILLVQTLNVTGTFFNLPGKEIPLSLCSLGAYLKSRGYRCGIVDLDFAGRVSPVLEEAVREARPKVVGISAYTPNVGIAGEIATRVKEMDRKLQVVLGGFHASALPERTLREFQDIDTVVVGEGEETLKQLMSILLDGGKPDKVRGVAYREGEGVCVNEVRPLIKNLDSLPFPDRGLVPVTEYIPDPGNYFQLPSSGILYSRGCPFKCTFCSKAVFGNRIRYRSVEHFIAEVESCIDRYGIRDFRLEDEAPTVDVRRVIALCKEIIQRRMRITWSCFSRVDTVDEEVLGLMKEAGCYHVTYGIESANQGTLEKIGKRIDLGQAAAAVKLTKTLGIECKANFILGFPWETAADMRSIVHFAKRISPDLVTFNLFKPLPGSALFNELEASGGLHHTSWDDYFTTGESLLFDASFTEEEAGRILRWAVFSYYFRLKFVVQRLRRMVRHPRREAGTVGRGIRILAREMFGLFHKVDRPQGNAQTPST
ncbi:B12-binding domain-containing radical SAM protein [Thermodesulfobacteriota bacterium]